MKAITQRILTAGMILAMILGVLPFGTVNAAPSQYVTPGATVFINEIHYDNTGTDAGEAIEIAGPAGTDLTGWSIVLYNGTGGAVYDTDPLTGTIPNQSNGYGTVVLNYPLNGVQNGSPDGVALVNGTTVVMFLSYEGTFVAVGGAANGLASTDIGVSETGTEPLGLSLQLTGSGATYDDFTWAAAAASTFGASNTGQSFVSNPVDTAPTVVSSVPANGATGVPPNQAISVTFSEAVTAGAGAFTLSCNNGPVETLSASSLDNITYALSGGTLVPDVSCVLTVAAGFVTDQDGTPNNMVSDYTATFTASVPICEQPVTHTIPQIQGSGATVAITGSVTTQGVVVADYEGASPALRGFYIQDLTGDGNPATSDGIFVFEGNNANTVSVGDNVRITGNAGENQGQSQVSVGTIIKCGTATVTPTEVTLPFTSATDPERYEGMLVRVPQTLYVTEHFQLGRFGQVVLSGTDRLQQPTNVTTPGAAAIALQAQNNLNKIILDDGTQAQNPDPIIFARNNQPLSATNTLRGGDTITELTGVLAFTWAGNSASGNAYRIRPTNAPGETFTFVAANPRPTAPPEVGGTIKVVGMNTLNFFNTFDGLPDNVDNCTYGTTGGPTDCRGADTQVEFDRQWPKTVAAILKMDPDVLGINEIENDGYGPDSAIQFLVNKLNEATAPGTYAFIDADAETGAVDVLGSDAIKVGLIYKPAKVTPVGQTAVLNTGAFGDFLVYKLNSNGTINYNETEVVGRSRPAIAQAFQQNSNGARVIVSVNHLKSKGSTCANNISPLGADPDLLDGQGNCNATRLAAANELAAWLATNPTGTADPDILLVGDYNSYAMEDPITALKNAGYTNLVDSLVGPDAYSYVFDGQWGYLDHALGSPSIVSQVSGVGEYHINADEPSVLDYNTDFKSVNQISTLYAPDEFRVSDHDPVIVGLNLTNASPTSKFVTGGGWVQATEGDYTAGKANFTFDAKYTKNSPIPVGTTDLFYEASNLHFVSTGYDWLVIEGGLAALKGYGTVNGQGEYQFMLWAVDGKPDRFRIVIWSGELTEASIVYDSETLLPLGGGNITIRK